jgi:hypothetical protein
VDRADRFFSLSISHFVARISPAAILEEIRARLCRMIVMPDAREQMLRLQELGGRKVLHLDLVSAIQTGCVTDAFEVTIPRAGWEVTVVGTDAGGDHLGVILRFSTDRETAVLVMDFFLGKSTRMAADAVEGIDE